MRVFVALALTSLAAAPAAAQQGPAASATAVTFYGNPSSAISGGVVIPPNRAMVWTSGTTPAVADANAKPGARERFGDTRTQATSILKNIAGQLEKQGLSMRDVVYLRAYLVPDATKGNRIDMDGWSAAYGEVFGTAANPTKPARSTVGVSALVNADWLIEIEAFAVAPK
jgi:enamine deaminase RidA (YjgF/YER057c/UK114 family)